MAKVTFDLDGLRSFATGIALGSFARAADRLGRSGSAVSAQLKKLEMQAGTPLVRKAGRGLALTEAGEILLGYARRLIELNDEAAAALGGHDLEGEVRLGVQEDFAEMLLPTVLGRFARSHPRVRIAVRVARNAALLEGVATGRLDLALAWDDGGGTMRGMRVAEVPMRWIGLAGTITTLPPGAPIPLAVFDAPCLFRSTALASLDRAGLPWRIAVTSPSLAGLWAAASAGLGVVLRTGLGLPAGIGVVETGLPSALPVLPLRLYLAEEEPGPVIERLAEILKKGGIRGFTPERGRRRTYRTDAKGGSPNAPPCEFGPNSTPGKLFTPPNTASSPRPTGRTA